jgi:hypothetical protein
VRWQLEYHVAHQGPSRGGTVEDVDGGNGIEAVVTVDDPGTFNAPWWGSAQWQKGNRPIIESICAENNLNYEKYFKLKEYPMPEAKTLDFWRTRRVACCMSVTNWQDGSVVSIATVVTAPTVPILSRMLEWWCLRV